MRDAAPQTIYLADYTPFGFLIDSVALTFKLHPTKTTRLRLPTQPAMLQDEK